MLRNQESIFDMNDRTKKNIVIMALCSAIVFVITGCSIGSSVEVFRVPEQSLIEYKDWHELEEGLHVREYAIEGDKGIKEILKVFKFESGLYRINAHHNSTSPKTISEWSSQLHSQGLIINGSYFNENFEPTGYTKILDKKYGSQTYDGKNGYTGIIAQKNATPEILYAPQNKIDESEYEIIVSTFPTIINDGASTLTTDTKQLARRTIVASDMEGNLLVIFSPRNVLSLYEISQFLVTTDLSIDIAVNLDGGPSSGYSLITPHQKLEQTTDVLPLVIEIVKND